MRKVIGMSGVRGTMLALAVALLPAQLAAAGPLTLYSPTWTAESTGSSATIKSLSCTSDSSCYAVGGGGTILHSTNANTASPTWSVQASGTSHDILSVSCAAGTTVCYAVGWDENIYKTTDGNQWTAVVVAGSTNTPQADWTAVSCADAVHCHVVAQGPFTDAAADPAYANDAAVLATADGLTWTRQYTPARNGAVAVSCSSSQVCAAGGVGGNIVQTINGGSTWTLQNDFTTPSVPTVLDVSGMSCPTPSTCYASLANNIGLNPSNVLVDTTADQPNGGGWSFTLGPTANIGYLYAISCPSTTTCFAGGEGQQMISTVSQGIAWTPQPTPLGVTYGITCTASRCHAGGTSGGDIAHN